MASVPFISRTGTQLGAEEDYAPTPPMSLMHTEAGSRPAPSFVNEHMVATPLRLSSTSHDAYSAQIASAQIASQSSFREQYEGEAMPNERVGPTAFDPNTIDPEDPEYIVYEAIDPSKPPLVYKPQFCLGWADRYEPYRMPAGYKMPAALEAKRAAARAVSQKKRKPKSSTKSHTSQQQGSPAKASTPSQSQLSQRRRNKTKIRPEDTTEDPGIAALHRLFGRRGATPGIIREYHSREPMPDDAKALDIAPRYIYTSNDKYKAWMNRLCTSIHASSNYLIVSPIIIDFIRRARKRMRDRRSQRNIRVRKDGLSDSDAKALEVLERIRYGKAALESASEDEDYQGGDVPASSSGTASPAKSAAGGARSAARRKRGSKNAANTASVTVSAPHLETEDEELVEVQPTPATTLVAGASSPSQKSIRRKASAVEVSSSETTAATATPRRRPKKKTVDSTATVMPSTRQPAQSPKRKNSGKQSDKALNGAPSSKPRKRPLSASKGSDNAPSAKQPHMMMHDDIEVAAGSHDRVVSVHLPVASLSATTAGGPPTNEVWAREKPRVAVPRVDPLPFHGSRPNWSLGETDPDWTHTPIPPLITPEHCIQCLGLEKWQALLQTSTAASAAASLSMRQTSGLLRKPAALYACKCKRDGDMSARQHRLSCDRMSYVNRQLAMKRLGAKPSHHHSRLYCPF